MTMTMASPTEETCARLLWLACLLAVMGAAAAPAQTASEIVLHNFGLPPLNGAHPQGSLIADPAGNLYGTTSAGGTWGAGVVYKLDTVGQQTVLYAFRGTADGGAPSAGVIRDAAGNLYGTALVGGTASSGVVYKLDPAGRQTVLYSFTGGADGGQPYAGVIHDSAGNLYGTTYAGGSANAGVVFKLDAAGREVVLYAFTGGADGGNPMAGVVAGPANTLYGTTSRGGTAGLGAVYKLVAPGQEIVLYSFTGGTDEGEPNAVILDPAGNLYGTTYGSSTSWGTVYRLDTAGNYTGLYRFTGGDDGGHPDAGVIRDPAGNLYGTTYDGGNRGGGVVFQVAPQ